MRRRIGAGGFATVWLAHDEQLDSDVAIKVLADNWAADHHVRQRFIDEGRFLRKVESPHVVSVYDAGELDDGRPYLVMTYADQGTLADRLEIAPQSPVAALGVVRQVGDGLHALHVRGILHRDVKPANVLFRTGSDGEVRAMVADLGLGKTLDMSSRLTMIAGTPSYVAPEQARGEGLDARADLYSLASLTYLLLTGRAPYSHATIAAAAEPGPPAPMGEVVPADVDAVVRRALAPQRDDRYPDVPSYTRALREAYGDELSTTPPVWLASDRERTQVVPVSLEPDSPRRRRVPAWAVGVLAVVIGLGGGYVVHRAVNRTVEITDDEGTLSVSVPGSWTTVEARDGWIPPGTTDDQPAVAAGSRSAWRSSGEGVFVGLLEGRALPTTMPQHPECDKAGQPYNDRQGGDDLRTVVYTDCPGVIVERVVQVNTDRLLWVQVRSDDRATANRVLDSVSTSGL